MGQDIDLRKDTMKFAKLLLIAQKWLNINHFEMDDDWSCHRLCRS